MNNERLHCTRATSFVQTISTHLSVSEKCNFINERIFRLDTLSATINALMRTINGHMKLIGVLV